MKSLCRNVLKKLQMAVNLQSHFYILFKYVANSAWNMLLFFVGEMSSFVQEMEKFGLHFQSDPSHVNLGKAPAMGLFCCFEYRLKGLHYP